MQPGKSNYFIGNNSASWPTDIPRYGRIEYRQVYPGIDVVYYGGRDPLEYDFVLGPQADPDKIRLEFQGADGMHIDAAGNLAFRAGGIEILERKPVVYQATGESRRLVEARYISLGGNRVGIEVSGYDRSKPLVIDPALVFSTFFGGSGNDSASTVVVDANGNYYVSGFARSNPLPGGANLGAPFSGSPGVAAFIVKMSASGTLIFSTFIGGNNDQAGGKIAVDANGNVYMAGSTASATFPVVNAIQSSYGGGSFDAFVLELSNSGNSLIYSTYLGGNQLDNAAGVAVDSSGGAYIVGYTNSTNFPANNAVQTALAGFQNAFAAKLTPGGTALVYSTYYGGNGTDYSNGMTLDRFGNSYMYGDTSSTNFPLVNPQGACSGGGWVASLSPSGTVGYSTYICGSNAVRGAAVDPTSGNLVITGQTSSTTFVTTTNAIQQNLGGGSGDAFVTELSPGGNILYSSYLGGNGTDIGRGTAVDSLGNWYITGQTSSTDFPTVSPIQATFGGVVANAFLTKINPNTTPVSIVFSTYLGGNQNDAAHFVAVDSNAQAYLAGVTNSTNFPVFHAVQGVLGGGNDGFWSVIATCDRNLSSPGPFPASGGVGNISITTTPECGWKAASQVPWIVLTPSNPSGAGNGSVSYTVQANNGPARSGSVVISGQAVVFNQAGVSPATFTSSPSGAAFTVTGAGCAPGSYTTPANLVWTPNTNCTVSFPSPQAIGGTSGYVFSSAAVNGGASSSAN
ncbi:MAG TPA: SBBP repeat-containing protein, partial [Bryobacteraceae bacterium]|nr:SBBP repeat-containing protein [Bryobacteraceae bacterium]